MKITSLILIAVGSVFFMGMLQQEGDSGTPDTALGLSKTSVFEIHAPVRTDPNTSEPGDRPAGAPGFPEQPSVIPHGVAEFLPIVVGDNQCLDCHAVDEKVAGEPTPIPKSHYVDYRAAPGAVQDDVVGARYLCVSCHVSLGKNAPLVGNAFGE